MAPNIPDDGRKPHEWSEAEWRGLVGRASAGRSLKPAKWKNGARCAVALSFDSDHETNELRDGARSISRLSWGQYGTRRGIPRIKAVLDAHDVKASFFVPAVSAMLHPDEQRMLADEGHEIGLHGWIHELNTELAADTERELMLRAADMLETIAGRRPVGMRTPSWDYSPNTLAIACEMGLLYDSSLMADEEPYEVLADGRPTGLVELPVEWIRDDAVYFNMNRFGPHRPYTPPEAVLDIFTREFEGAWREGGLFLLTMHPHVIGYRSRIWILEALLERIRDHDDVWIATHAEIAEYVKREAGL